MATVYTMDDLKRIVTPIAQEYGVKKVSVFGSYAKGTSSPSSDLDLKIEKGQIRSLFQLCGFRLAVEDALSLPIDLVTSESSDQKFLDMIAKDEVLLYEQSG